MTIAFVVEHDGRIYAATDSSETCIHDPEAFLQTKLLWISKNMLMACAGNLRPLKILRDLAGSYQMRVATVESAADFIADWLQKLSTKEDMDSFCLLCGYDAQNQAQAFSISKLTGQKSTIETVDILATKGLIDISAVSNIHEYEGQIDQAIRAQISPYKAMSDTIYDIIDRAAECQAPVIHQIIRPELRANFS
jgi:hypothetical protein